MGGVQKILCAPLEGLVVGGGEGEGGERERERVPVIEGVLGLFSQHMDVLLSDNIGEFSLSSRLLVVFSRFVFGGSEGKKKKISLLKHH